MSCDPFCLIGHLMEPTGASVRYEGDPATYAVMRCARCGAEKHRRIGPPQWKCGDEFAPYHPDASHVSPEYRDGWNACYAAAQRAAAQGGRDAR